MKKYLLGLLLTTTLTTAHAAPIFTAPSTWNLANTNSVIKSQIGQANGVAPLDKNGLMSAGVSGIVSNASAQADHSNSITRTVSSRWADTVNLNDYISAWDGSTAFQNTLSTLLATAASNAIVTLPCGTKFPFYNTKTGYAWGPTTPSGVLFIDQCGATWNNAPSWATSAIDRGLGDNNPVLTQYNGTVLLNRQNSSNTNGVGLLSSHITNWATSTTQYPGDVDADYVNGLFTIDNMKRGTDGTSIVRGSPVSLRSIVNNYSDQTWQTQAQAFKPTCNNFTWGGSCWAVSTELNDKSGHSPKAFNLQNEDDLSGNGDENPASTYDPKQSYRIMDYASSIAQGGGGWYTSASHAVGDQVVVTDSAGDGRVLIATAAGTSSTTIPVPSTTEGDTLTDGTVTWEIGAKYSVVVGAAHWINMDASSASTNSSYNFGFSTNAKFNNAVFDASHAVMNNPRAAALRMAPNQFISFNDSPNASSDSDLNKNTLMYNSTYKELVYSAAGNNVFWVTDDGMFNIANSLYASVLKTEHDVDAGGSVTASNTVTSNAGTTVGSTAIAASLQIGGSNSTSAAINMKSTASAPNAYDVQMIAQGGGAGTNGQGTLTIKAVGGVVLPASTPLNVTGTSKLTGVATFGSFAALAPLTKTNILASTSSVSGMVAYDATDKVPVIYINGSWYPMTLGAALSQ